MMDLERQTPAAAHWPRQHYESLFAETDVQRQAERLAWVVDHELQQELNPTTPFGICAFLVAHRVAAEWELENIVVAEGARHRGLGTLLVREMVDHAKAKHASAIFLEVRCSNRNARALYRKLRFEEAGLRKSYYSDPTEDAILYRLRLV